MSDSTNGNGSTVYGATPFTPELESFAKKITDMLIARITNKTGDLTDPNATVVGKFLGPKELSQHIEFDIPEEQNFDFEKMEKTIQFLMSSSTRADHPMFFNQLFAAPDPVAIIGDWCGAAMNCTMATFEMSGNFIMMEKAVMKMARQAIGWENGDGDGQMCPGGSACNQMGVMLARYQKFPETKTSGMFGTKPMVIFTSDEAHYSMDKSAFMCGFGLDNLVKVPCDNVGRMDAKAFETLVEQTIADGKIPLVVNATAGTTVRGAFDPFDKIGAVCKKHGIWMHIDGAWGGPAIFSRQYEELMKGSEMADSFTMDAHKCLGSTQQCAMVLVKHDGLLAKCNSANAAYLFQADKPHAEYDTGDKTVQCGRRNDILKAWLAWQGLGMSGIAQRVDNTYALARKLYQKLTSEKRREQGFITIQEPAASNTLYYCIPSSLQSDPIAQRLLKGESPYELLRKPEAVEFARILGTVAPFVKAKTVSQGTMMCGFQAVCGLPNFWRIVFANPNMTDEQLDAVLDITHKHSEEWVVEQEAQARKKIRLA